MVGRFPNAKGEVLHRNTSHSSLDRIPDAESAQPLLKQGPQVASNSRAGIPHLLKAGAYLIANVVSASSIVFANKAVLTVINFKFVYALTLLHVVTTLLGMLLFASFGLYERKKLPLRPLVSLSAAFVGYIVFWNISLKVNTVGFYQLSKICITPAVLVFDAMVSRKLPTRKEGAAVFLLCIGVALATISDADMSTNFFGLAIALAAVGFTAVYQVFAGSKQKELEVGSMALMAGYTPIASLMLLCLVPIFEPLGVSSATPDTLLGFDYTWQAVGLIGLTAILGLAVSLSTFLVIGATSSVTYNVVGHVKTVVVLGGGCLIFGESLSAQRFAGVCVAMTGILWYSYLKFATPPSNTEEKLPTAQPRSNSHTRLDRSSVGVLDAEKRPLLPPKA